MALVASELAYSQALGAQEDQFIEDLAIQAE